MKNVREGERERRREREFRVKHRRNHVKRAMIDEREI